MTMTAEDYINQVLQVMPAATPLKSQIALELRGHIAERVGGGQPVEDVLRLLGDPVALAESYLSAEPLVSASFGSRVAAKLIDVIAVMAVTAIMMVGPAIFLNQAQVMPLQALFPMWLMAILVAGSFVFGAYTILAEHTSGQTFGKKIMHLRVVRESGARITFGQAVVRQLPMFLQVFLIDVMFACFTEKSQRAFEVLSKTRVVVVAPDQQG